MAWHHQVRRLITLSTFHSQKANPTFLVAQHLVELNLSSKMESNPPIHRLPAEIVSMITPHLDFTYKLNLKLTSKHLSRIIGSLPQPYKYQWLWYLTAYTVEQEQYCALRVCRWCCKVLPRFQFFDPYMGFPRRGICVHCIWGAPADPYSRGWSKFRVWRWFKRIASTFKIYYLGFLAIQGLRMERVDYKCLRPSIGSAKGPWPFSMPE